MLELIIYIAGLTLPTHAVDLRIYGNSLTEFDTKPLNNAVELLNSSYYNSTCSNYMYTFGYLGQVNGTATETSLTDMISLKQEYFATTICKNVLLLDWSKEASSTTLFGELGMQLTYAFKTIWEIYVIGAELGEALINMSSKGFDLSGTHMVAHSLGAHLFGAAGRFVKINGTMVGRITGLDPAGPLYENPPLSFPPLDSTCATFVDCIHTDPGGYGINASRCTVDFWANFGIFISGPEEGQVQPGCDVGDFPFMSIQDRCSHDRAWRLMSETAYNSRTLLGSKAVDYYAWAAGITSTVTAFGYDTDTTAEGDFYLVTNAASIFGKGEDGTHL